MKRDVKQLKDSIILKGLVSKVTDRTESLLDVCVIKQRKDRESKLIFFFFLHPNMMTVQIAVSTFCKTLRYTPEAFSEPSDPVLSVCL